MSRLPLISGKEVIKVLVKDFGYEIARMKGSHVTLVKSGNPLILTVPLHEQLDRGTLKSILRKANVDVEVFVSKP